MHPMNYYEAMAAMRQAEPDPRIRMPEITLMNEFLFVWNEHRRPSSLNAEQWKVVIDGAARWMSRAAVYTTFGHLLEAGWLSCFKPHRTVQRVSIGAALQSTRQTHGEESSPGGGLASPGGGLPYYVQGTREDVQDLQGARERVCEGEGGSEVVEESLSYTRLVSMFEAVFERKLSREAFAQLAQHSREFLEPIAAYYSAPPGEDERRYRRRSFEALMANVEQEHDRAVMWLRSEAAKPYRPQRDLDEWKDLIRSLPETVLPLDWTERWEAHMRETPRPWAEIGPKSRQAFLACLFSDGMVNRVLADTNPTVARYFVKRWLRQIGRAV